LTDLTLGAVVAPPAKASVRFLTLDAIQSGALGDAASRAADFRAMAGWTRAFLMSAHPDLGRDGDVCPFTSMGARLGLLRFAVSDATPDDPARIAREARDAFAAFEDMPHAPRMGNFRAVLLGFPNCADERGIAALGAAQKALRLTSFRRARMIGVFHAGADAPGLWNPDFRPLRSPIPLIAFRALVEQDAPFVTRHPLLAPSYLRAFPIRGSRRLIARLWARS
jgi:hypothetical protein